MIADKRLINDQLFGNRLSKPLRSNHCSMLSIYLLIYFCSLLLLSLLETSHLLSARGIFSGGGFLFLGDLLGEGWGWGRGMEERRGESLVLESWI